MEDLYRLLARVKEEAGVTAVSVGAILSDYQRVRVEHVCSRLGLTVLAFLWQRDQSELLSEMISAGLEAVLVKVWRMSATRGDRGTGRLCWVDTMVTSPLVTSPTRQTVSWLELSERWQLAAAERSERRWAVQLSGWAQ